MAVLLIACSPSAQPARPAGETAAPSSARREDSRPLVIIVRVEPVTLAHRALQSSAGTALYLSRRAFNSQLALIDDKAVPQPELAESLPALHTDSWIVHPDGSMTTKYRLKAGLTWHD